MNTKLLKVTRTLAKIVEVVAWVVAGIMAIALVLGIALKDVLSDVINQGIAMGQFTSTEAGYVVNSAEDVLNAPNMMTWIAGMLGCTLMAMIFHNICLVFKSNKPFCNDNVRSVKLIGYCAFAVPMVEIVCSVIAQAIGGPYINVYIDLKQVVFGFVVLALSQYFQYGCQLEDEVDGLL